MCPTRIHVRQVSRTDRGSGEVSVLSKVLFYPRVTLSEWVPKVNTSDPVRSRFEGWIAISGLPFCRWSLKTFQSIGSSCGGLEEIHPIERIFSNLFEAKIKVKSTRA